MWEDTGLFRCKFSLLIFERVYSLFPWLRQDDGNFPNMFLHFMKYQVKCLFVDMLKYVKILAACGNMCLKMMKNDKFQYLVTPPTSKDSCGIGEN